MKLALGLMMALASLIGGCSSTGRLASTTPGTPVDGTLVRDGQEPYRVEIVVDGKIYRGQWCGEAATPEQKAAVSYPHRKHLERVQTTLTADDGAALACSWLTVATEGTGSCTDGTREFPMTLK